MRVSNDPLQQFRQGSLFQVVDVHQPDGSPSADMLLLLAALKTDGYGKAGTGRFLLLGCISIVICYVVTILQGAFFYCGILSDHPDDFTECCVRRQGVRITFEKAECNVFHGIDVLKFSTKVVKGV